MSFFPGSSSDNKKSSSNNSSSTILSGRVKNILLNSSDLKFFKEVNGWAGLGTIKFKLTNKTLDNGSFMYAKPLFNNIKTYPLKEEIVLIFNSLSNKTNDNSHAVDLYYLPVPVNVWNNINHNVMPDITNYNSTLKDINFGETFKEQIIKNIIPEEGDTIIEGRFNNSIRLSSTTIKKDLNNNSWSSKGENGSPIIIIRNGSITNDSNPWTPIYEDINNDDSSIYITSTQEIPLELGCKNLKSFNITLTNSFNSAVDIPEIISF